MIALDDTELQQWVEDIGRFPALAQPAAAGAMEQTMLFLHGTLPSYPGGPAPRGQAAKNWTEKQRRFFFAALRKGQIASPYKRTGTLGRSFTTQVTVSADAVEGELGTNVSYAPWVVGPAYPGETIRGQQMFQAAGHAGRWWQLDQVFAANRDQAWQIFGDEFFSRFSAAVGAQP